MKRITLSLLFLVATTLLVFVLNWIITTEISFPTWGYTALGGGLAGYWAFRSYNKAL